MTGLKALKKVRKGHKVRRTHWLKGEYVYQRLGTLDQHDEIVWAYDGKGFLLRRLVEATEFLHDDWNIYE